MVSLAFFQGIHLIIDVRIDISISIRPMIPKFGKQVPKFESNEADLAGTGDVILSRSRDKLKTSPPP